MMGDSFVVSLRCPGQGGQPYTRLSTAEFKLLSRAAGTLLLEQHCGPGNGPPPVEAQEALRSFEAAVASGGVPLEASAMTLRHRGEAVAGNALGSQCRYDWTVRANVGQAVSAWKRTLPRRFRGKDIGRLAEIFSGGKFQNVGMPSGPL